MQAIGWTKKLFAKNPMKDARRISYRSTELIHQKRDPFKKLRNFLGNKNKKVAGN